MKKYTAISNTWYNNQLLLVISELQRLEREYGSNAKIINNEGGWFVEHEEKLKSILRPPEAFKDAPKERLWSNHCYAAFLKYIDQEWLPLTKEKDVEISLNEFPRYRNPAGNVGIYKEEIVKELNKVGYVARLVNYRHPYIVIEKIK